MKSRERKELSHGDVDCHCGRGCALSRTLGSVLHLVHPSRESAGTHLVHLVEAPGSLRHRSRTTWWDPTDSTLAPTMRGGLITETARSRRRADAGRRGGNRASPSTPLRSPPGGPSWNRTVPRALRAELSEQLLQTGSTILDERAQRQNLRPLHRRGPRTAGRPRFARRRQRRVRRCRPSLRSASRPSAPSTPADPPPEQTVGGQIVDRDRNHEPFDSRGSAALAQRPAPRGRSPSAPLPGRIRWRRTARWQARASPGPRRRFAAGRESPASS